MVIGPQPAVKRGGAFGAGSVDRAVGPAAEHRADEPFCLSVGAWPVGPRAQVPQSQQPAGGGVDRRDIAGAVVAHHALHGDPVAGVEPDRAAQEARGGHALLVREYLDVGQARGVVDADVHKLPAGDAAALAVAAGLLLACALPGDAVSGAANASEFLDVDMDELARPRALITIRWLER